MHPLMQEHSDPIWDRHGLGRSARQIGRDLGIGYRRVTRHITNQGGIRPATRFRSGRHLRMVEREEISRGIAAGLSSNCIGAGLGRSASTVSREIARNGGREAYRAVVAEQAAWDRARRPKETKLAADPVLRRAVVDGLDKKWSPEQIAGRLALQNPNDPDRCVSHESIYRAVYLPAKSHMPGGLKLPLRTKRTFRRSKAHVGAKKQRRGQLKDITLIGDRPAEVENRSDVGHWEGDLVLGTGKSGVATLVERVSRYTEVIKLNGLTSPAVTDAVSAHIQSIPNSMCSTLTWDQGKEMAQHKRLAAETGIPIYFCDPRSPWQRGTNENTNGLLRQYFPKRIANLNDYSQADLNDIASELNDRPRKTLGYRTPTEVFADAMKAGSAIC